MTAPLPDRPTVSIRFSAAEIAGYKAKAGSMTGADVAKLHAGLEGK